MRWKFAEGMYVKSKKLTEYYSLKGYDDREIYQVYAIEKDGGQPSANWGLWITSQSKTNPIRLQDIGGLVTGHGMHFVELTAEEKKLLGFDEEEKTEKDPGVYYDPREEELE
jgi:hypothetical protein